MKKVLKNQLGHLFYGVVFWFPIIISIIVFRIIFVELDKIGQEFLDLFMPLDSLQPSLGLVLWLMVFYLSGVFLKKPAAKKFLSKIPIIGVFLGEESQVITLGRLLNLPPCIFLFSPTCPSYGWLLQEQKITLGFEKRKENSRSWIHVYYPNVPTIATGQVFISPKENVIKLGNSSASIIKALEYNLATPEELIFLPWENEEEKDFQKRVKLFGTFITSNDIKAPTE